MDKNIMNVGQVAIYLGLSPSTIYKLCREGEIPHSRLGRQFKFSKTAIDKMMEGK
tara:strand:- start:700 stop:864 length:165 start_codon:yes stop_codon:yes gene_type:complete